MVASASDDSMVLLKMWLILIGIYIWEFFTSLYYEWDVIRGRSTYLWTIWIYLITRWSTIAVVILLLINFNVTSPINCQAWAWTSWAFAFLGQGPGSLLLALRVFAIWNRNKWIVTIIAIIWMVNVSLLLLGAVRIHAVWEPAAKSCVVTNVHVCKVSMVSCLVADTIMLLVMLAGLLRLRHSGKGYELWHLLWKQGVIWFVVATIAEVPPALFMTLNVNDVLNMMFLFPSLVITVIATTRMYRSLQYFVPPYYNTAPDSNGDQKTRNNGRLPALSKTKNSGSIVRIPSNRLEVAVHTVYEEYPMQQMNHSSPYPSPDKPRELDLDYKVVEG